MDVDEPELIRSMYAAFSRGDFEAAAAPLADDVEWHDPSELPGSDVHRGPEGVKRFWEEFTDPFETYVMEARSIERVGDHWVADVRVSGHGRASGLDAEADFTQVWTIAGGRVTRSRSFLARADALRAVREEP
jgi:ketosteroid isomerase-like protein